MQIFKIALINCVNESIVSLDILGSVVLKSQNRHFMYK